MFHSLSSVSRLTVAVAFVFALLLSTVPAHALPGETDAPGFSTDASWFDTALSWIEDFLGLGGDSEPLQSMTTGSRTPTSGSCIDPYGRLCGDNL
jgi:hypothetical protein